MAYGLTVYYFAVVNMTVLRYDSSAFAGVEESGGLWEFIYYSVITITTLGYGDIHPESKLAQGLAVVEVLLGFFFVIFLFGAFVSYRIGQIARREEHTGV